MPFLTEEIWQKITAREPQEALIVANWPGTKSYDAKLLAGFDTAAEVISGIRAVRKEKNISFKDSLELLVLNAENHTNEFDSTIAKLGNISELKIVENKVESALSFRVGANEYFIPISGPVDRETEIEKLQEELTYNEGFLKSVEKKLSNERFVAKAPEKVVEMERRKKTDAEAKIETIKLSLKALGA